MNSVYEKDTVLNDGLEDRSLTILRLPDVIKRTGYSRSSIYQKISEGIFPKPIILGARASGWLESEIVEWINKRIKITRESNAVDATLSNNNV